MSVLAILGLAKALLAAANGLIGYLDKKQLIDAGMAKGVLVAIRQANQVISDAQQAIRHVRNDPNSEYAKRLRDKYTKRG